MYANCKPIVCAHDSVVADIRLTSVRPKIIKLHGDFLYDSIKNTIRETETLEKNMRDKFTQFAVEYGLVVIGYRGNDRSIMDILETLARSGNYFPHGVYWCVRSGSKICRKLQRLIGRENVYLVEIDGFDEFMAELHEGLGLELPASVRDPYRATTEKLNRFILPTGSINHPIIKKDMAELEAQVKRFEKIISKIPSEEKLVPSVFLGDREYARGSYRKSAQYYATALKQDPQSEHIALKLWNAYFMQEKFAKATMIGINAATMHPHSIISQWMYIVGLKTLKISQGLSPVDIINYVDGLLRFATDNSERTHYLLQVANCYLQMGEWQKAIQKADETLALDIDNVVALINKSAALKKLGKEEEAGKILREILVARADRRKSHFNLAGVFALLGEKQRMLRNLRKAIKDDPTLRILSRSDPAFEEYREDPDFRKLVAKNKREKDARAT